MFDLFINWYKKRFADPHAISFAMLLILIFIIIYFFHNILFPILIAIVCSYLLEWPTVKLQKLGISRLLAVLIVLLLFLTLMAIAVIFILPMIWQQGMNLLTDIPNMLTLLNNYLLTLPQRFPELVNVGLFDLIIDNAKRRIMQTGDSLLKLSIASLFGLINIMVYMVIIPLMSFFILKDKYQLLSFLNRFLPKNREMMHKVAKEMNDQISNYLLGKALEIIIVTVATFIIFWYLDLSYSLLLSVGVGLSVIIPYIGMFVITIPVVGVALFQYGVSSEFWLIVAAYSFIQFLDSNVLGPLLYSEVVNLSPFTIMVSVIIFGGLWGFWGVVFAIPLATFIKTIINIWPENQNTDDKSITEN